MKMKEQLINEIFEETYDWCLCRYLESRSYEEVVCEYHKIMKGVK